MLLASARNAQNVEGLPSWLQQILHGVGTDKPSPEGEQDETKTH